MEPMSVLVKRASGALFMLSDMRIWLLGGNITYCMTALRRRWCKLMPDLDAIGTRTNLQI